MIKSFTHKGLADLFRKGRTNKIDVRMHRRILSRLDALNSAESAGDMNVPGYAFHPLKGFSPVRYSIHVNGLWCITFELEAGDAFRVNLEQYH